MAYLTLQMNDIIEESRAQLDIARDNGYKNYYLEIKPEEDGYPWSPMIINQILKGLQDLDVKLLSHSITTYQYCRNKSNPMAVVQQRQQITFLFELIYN
jgi:hypothetical protein